MIKQSRIISFFPGLLLCALIAMASTWLGNLTLIQHQGLTALTIAILVGMAFGNTVYGSIETHVRTGVLFCKQRLLKAGVVLYGFRITFQDIADVGLDGVVSATLMLLSTFFLALFIGVKIFKLSRASVILIGAGSSICGAAAIMAADSVIKAKSEDVSVAVATVVVFGSIAIFLYPFLYQLNLHAHWISSDSVAFGVYTGSTIHEVAQVVAAGLGINAEISDVAVITKMVRVMMLAPLLLLLPLFDRSVASTHTKKIAPPIPWFALLFVAVAVLNSLHIVPAAWVDVIVQIDTILLATAMTALGLTTHFSAIRTAGIKPLLLALILFIWLIVGGAMVNRAVF